MLKRTLSLCSFLFLLYTHGFAQVNEHFADGNFTTNPTWSGSADSWIVNPSMQLQSNNQVLNSSFYLSTANTLATHTQWEFTTLLPFNPSSTNYVDVFLTASASDLLSAALTGYFVRIGNTDDEISLYRKDASGSAVKIIDGINGVTNNSNNTLSIKVIRTANNQFTLLRDITGTTSNYFSEGSATDATYISSSFFGVLVKQSTATFFQKHLFTFFEVKPYVADITPPLIVSITAASPNQVNVLFNEPVEQTSAQLLANYTVNNGIGRPVQAVRDAANASLVRLTFAGNFSNGVNLTLTVVNVKDLADNAIVNASGVFSFFVAQRYDVVIAEIMADPTPIVQLPDAEYVELKNTTNQPINLQGWRLASSTSISGPFASYILPADSMVVLTGTSSVAVFSGYGRVLGVTSFPSLNNSGTLLSLLSRENVTIHAVDFNDTWYQNAVKSNGGWSLEMIDTKNPCAAGSNWRASINAKGGTPAQTNSINAVNKDDQPPALLRAAAPNSQTLLLTFSEPLDSAKASTATNYVISDGVVITAARAIAPLFTTVQLTLGSAISAGKVFTITANNVSDCSGNVVLGMRTAKVGLASVIDTFDIVINEVLFNPAPNAVDYVELYNRSNKIFDLKDIYISNRSSAGQLGTLKQLTTGNLLLFPGDYFVVSESRDIVKQFYTAKNPDNFVEVSGMPSYPDAAGTVLILNAQGTIVDELNYSDKWHFGLLDNEEGISLERIDYNKKTQSKDNWFSAASTSGYGTPTYQNSQFRMDLQLQGEVTITPKTFSPDNDGNDDFALINYQMADLGYVANITIFDAAGRQVKNLAKNATLALKGSFRWDGLDDKMNKLPIGTYVVGTEIFNLEGKKKNFKNAVQLARRF